MALKEDTEFDPTPLIVSLDLVKQSAFNGTVLDFKAASTSYSLKELVREVHARNRPLVLWVGAGASTWAGFPLWKELAKAVHSDFAAFEPKYSKDEGRKLLSEGKFPELFDLCSAVNEQRYYKSLLEHLRSPGETPIYKRFIETLKGITPLHILTTNVDDALERHLPVADQILSTDLERLRSLLEKKAPFVTKLHGTLGSAESLVFRKRDYDQLISNQRYLDFLGHIGSTCSLLFVGYGISDEYVLRLLHDSSRLNSLLGDGPHFAVLPSQNESLPASVRQIQYVPAPHKDHRSSIQVIEEVARAQQPDFRFTAPTSKASSLRSLHLLSEINAPGVWQTSNTLTLSSKEGEALQVIIGTGITDQERPFRTATAMHDLLVGLLCFDQVLAPLHGLNRLHDLAGSEFFWELISSDAVRMIHWEKMQGMIFPNSDAIHGDLASMVAHKPGQDKHRVSEIISRHLRSAPGKEADARLRFEDLERKTHLVAESDASVPDITRGLLLRPSIRKMLGLSGGMSISKIPKWNMYPVLRLANLVALGEAARLLHAASIKLEYGSFELSGPVFAAINQAEHWSDDLARYVLSGRLDTDIGAFAYKDKSVLQAILRFRDTEEGGRFRREILARLLATSSSDIVAAINSGLTNVIPLPVLQSARDKMASLLLPGSSLPQPTPAVWNDSKYGAASLGLWRKESLRKLDEHCKKVGLTVTDLCPCESGEALKHCCRRSLEE